jgi:hypothetical protein
MHSNFQKIDNVFGDDVPICALNLKKLWCEYTCGVNKVMYVNGTGYKNVSIGN